MSGSGSPRRPEPWGKFCSQIVSAGSVAGITKGLFVSHDFFSLTVLSWDTSQFLKPSSAQCAVPAAGGTLKKGGGGRSPGAS